MMRTITKSTKSIRLLIASGIVSIPLIIFYCWGYSDIMIDVNYNCERTGQTEDYCLFNCQFVSSSDVKGRITVTHTVWASIYEEDFYGTKYSTQIKLPKRNYPYWLRVGVYNEDEYGMTEGWLMC